MLRAGSTGEPLMTNRAFVSLSLSALMVGGSLVGCAGGGDHVASASDTSPKVAATAADQAGKALVRGRADEAVRLAEQAVAARPQQVDYRLLLGQSYLKAGRFTSASQAFADVLQLQPDSGKAALNLALAQTGLGDWAGARAMLDAHAATIPAADRGLAMALAGDPSGAVGLLTAAVRSPDASVKTRQNLALALALAGRWAEAKAVAATDLSPTDVDRRMTQWAAFARPSGAADQVSSLLGVVPVVDAGQPIALALVAPAPVAAEPVNVADAPIVAAPEAAPVEVAASAVPVTAAVAATQPLPAEPVSADHHVVLAASSPQPARVVPARHAATGRWYVQIGAFQNAAVARNGWTLAVRRDAALRGLTPEGTGFRARTGQVYRLSVGGYSRGQADAICRIYRTHGGACFVRSAAGDQIAQWARKDVQLASR